MGRKATQQERKNASNAQRKRFDNETVEQRTQRLAKSSISLRLYNQRVSKRAAKAKSEAISKAQKKRWARYSDKERKKLSKILSEAQKRYFSSDAAREKTSIATKVAMSRIPKSKKKKMAQKQKMGIKAWHKSMTPEQKRQHAQKISKGRLKGIRK